MWQYLLTIIKNIIESFKTGDGGFSARKLSAFAAVSIGMCITSRFANEDNITDVLLAWLGFALLCLGIVTIEQIIKFKNGGSNEGSIQQQPDSDSKE